MEGEAAPAQGHDVVVPDAAEGLGVLLEGEVGGAPLLEQRGQHVRRLAPDTPRSLGCLMSLSRCLSFMSLKSLSLSLSFLSLKSLSPDNEQSGVEAT